MYLELDAMREYRESIVSFTGTQTHIISKSNEILPNMGTYNE